MEGKRGNYIALAVTLLALGALLLCSQAALESARAGLNLCAQMIVPSLLPFFILSSLLQQLGLPGILGRWLSPVTQKLFGIGGAGASALLLGVTGGYPLGADAVARLRRSGALTREQAERALAFCNNSGPLFIIGSVGTSMYFNETIGVMLYAIHLLSAVSVGIILGCFGRGKDGARTAQAQSVIRAKPLGAILKDAVVGAVNNMLLVCGFTVLFAVIIASLSGAFGDGIWAVLASGALEISTGVYNASRSALTLDVRLILTSAIIGFAGLSVHFQVIGIVSKTDLSAKRYLIGKLLQALIAAAYTAVALCIVPLDISAVSYYMYPIRAYELIDFAAAIKLSVLYMASAAFIILLLWLFEKVCAWQENMKYKK